MADDPESVVERYLRKISAEQSIIRETLEDQRSQLNSMRQSLIGMREDLKAMPGILPASTRASTGRMTGCPRIEKRLDLVEA